MQRISAVSEMTAWSREKRRQGETIGLVPTMGYLHEGHLTLVRQAKEQCDRVVVSIFVNPLQFGVNEDFTEYPRDLSRDENLAAREGVDVIFAPPVKGMYPQGFHSAVEVEKLTDRLCGRSRPGHFRGVTTVVTKLFNIVGPDLAFFGQKDAQQLAVIRRMVADLNMPLAIVGVPTVREPDGLAMSSRNVYLTPEQRQAALVLVRSLREARELIDQGEREAANIEAFIRRYITREPLAAIDYIEIVDNDFLQPLEKLSGTCLIALAVRFGNTRLIDNMVVEV